MYSCTGHSAGGTVIYTLTDTRQTEKCTYIQDYHNDNPKFNIFNGQKTEVEIFLYKLLKKLTTWETL